MTLRILNIAYALAPVHPATAGGAEQILGQIDSALVSAGHESIVVACKGSLVSGALVEGAELPGIINESARRWAHEQHRRAISIAMEKWEVDIVHMHGLDFCDCLPGPGPPVLVTLHLPLAWYPTGVLRPCRPRTYLHCVSESQEKTSPSEISLLPVVQNGIPLRNFAWRKEKKEFVLCMGRICPEKGFHLAMDAAEAAGIPLLLAGEVFGYESHRKYFREKIEPRLNGSTRVFLGSVDIAHKASLLAATKCLLVPSLAPETSSLVAMEALACGTPVVAFGAGALPEIIEDGKTGFIVRDVLEMSAAINEAGRLDPEDCRRAAEERFCSDRMIGDYFKLYEFGKAGGLESLLHKAGRNIG